MKYSDAMLIIQNETLIKLIGETDPEKIKAAKYSYERNKERLVTLKKYVNNGFKGEATNNAFEDYMIHDNMVKSMTKNRG